ncbi:putative bifunctional diguanylate cyclase/phosphodiesterase [Paenibacillus hexagrammi]|uniref:EAL domain-containing protein n=1 Tax=Paenibacillus hexagrammi TaxID=2908839 RepID=A0ABY3SIE5_9BACL|nr:EAL domain-containing protein [Paenibacillus sp. YPD9-1]UJF33558.1 EAL domain-containing protein [Paenibacillus sp. YPD9-1]
MSSRPVLKEHVPSRRYAWEYICLICVALLTVNLLSTVSVQANGMLPGVLFSVFICSALLVRKKLAAVLFASGAAACFVAAALLAVPVQLVSLCLHTVICTVLAYSIRRLLTAREYYKAHSSQMEYIANHDALTGLPNRRLFEDRLEQYLLHAKRHQQLVAVIFLDLNRFKDINDTMGHAYGDLLIRQAGERLLHCLRGDDTVYRQGGDEFTILLPFITKPEDVRHVAARIQKALEQPFLLEGHSFEVTASMGIALYPLDGDTPEKLMIRADEAMYGAKQKKDTRYQFYAADIDSMVASKARLEKELTEALERKEFDLRYQPQYEVASGRLIGMEAVIHWNKSEQIAAAPSEWMRLAEECGLMIPIGRWAIWTACLQAKSWRDAGYPPLRLTVGVTASQFKDGQFLDVMTDILKATGLDASWIELDMAEGIAASSLQEVGEKLRILKALGFRIAMDDMCTGLFTRTGGTYIPADSVKLDSTLIKGLPENGDNQELAEAIVTMAQRLQLNLIAKGVETKEQLEHLQIIRCAEAQGKWFSSPLDSAEFTRLLKEKIS